jgi:HAE1 family hydrophobic/amphiphilic exporter-1
MNQVIKFIFDRPITTGMIFLTILVLGIFALLKVPLELNPKVELPSVTITTNWYGTSSETMEAQITSPIEEMAATVRGVKNIKSESEMGSSTVTVEFLKEIDMSFALLELNEKLNNLIEEFPQGVVPFISKHIPKEISEQRFMTYSIAAPMEEVTLKKVADEKIKPALLSVPGVSEINIFGGLDRQIKILLDEKKLMQYGLAFGKVIQSLINLDYVKNVGAFEDKSKFLPIIVKQEINSLSEVGRAPIKISENNVIRLNQISTILDGSEENRTYSRVNGEPTITIELIKEPGKNIISTADQVELKIQKLTNDLPEIKFRKVYDQSTRLREELSSLSKQSLISFLGVFLILLIFLRNLKAPLIILSAIVFSIITVILFFSFLNVTLNILTLSGLSLGIGMLVDNSIVVYENIEYHRKKNQNLKEAIKLAVSEVSTALMASTFTTAVVFLPFFFLPENLKQMFLYFGIGMGLSIIVSLIFALTFIPFMAGKFSRKGSGWFSRYSAFGRT